MFLATTFTIDVVLLAGSQVGSRVAGSAMDLIPLACASLVILAVGLFDNVYYLRGRQKLAGQLIAVAILVGSGLLKTSMS